jgi:hypothetical protein
MVTERAGKYWPDSDMMVKAGGVKKRRALPVGNALIIFSSN